MEAAKKGVKETLDLLTVVEHLLVAVDISHTDGKIELVDLPKFLPLLHEMYGAMKGISEIPDELKDLEAVELQQIAQKAVDILILGVRMVFPKVPL